MTQLPPNLDPNSEAAKILADPTLSPAAKKHLLRLRKENVQNEFRTNEVTRDQLLGAEAAYKWVVDAMENCVWTIAKESRLHKLAAGPIHQLLQDNTIAINERLDVRGFATFLMQSNWAKLVADTEADVGEYRLPADRCCFEFQLNGQRLIIMAYQDLDGYQGFLQGRDGWWMLDHYVPNSETFKRQIRALCILLEADAIEAEVIRAPHKLNAARERRGKLPIYDHHILKLKDRKRYGALEPSGNERASPRLHFRRGHWRHYQGHKTWIKWQLVGDASLGFVDKDYAY